MINSAKRPRNCRRVGGAGGGRRGSAWRTARTKGEHAEVAGRGELLLGPAAHCGKGLLGGLDGVQRLDLLELGGQALVEQGKEQLILVGEVGVDGALGVAGRLGDLVNRGGMEAPTGEHLAGGVEQPGAGLLAALRSGQSGHAVPPGSSLLTYPTSIRILVGIILISMPLVAPATPSGRGHHDDNDHPERDGQPTR